MNKNFSLGLFLGIILVGCASATFPYKFYYPESTGDLRGDSPSEDLPGSTCDKNQDGTHSCVVFKKDVAQAMIIDYLDLQDKLIQCQRSCR